ncbi:MAG: septal ring lytic transglycosylase RlpA family protein [bacterium]|nr:septal ring lytic transglycosylase RlpA family protein [bacterium]
MTTVLIRAGGAIPRLFLLCLGLAFCLTTVPARADLVSDDDYPPERIGKASWYGPGFVGRKTASGDRFDPNLLTGAHRTLPLGTKVRVTNLKNGRSVLITINDRGPFIRHRELDLSEGAARELQMKGQGVAQVLIQPL